MKFEYLPHASFRSIQSGQCFLSEDTDISYTHLNQIMAEVVRVVQNQDDGNDSIRNLGPLFGTQDLNLGRSGALASKNEAVNKPSHCFVLIVDENATDFTPMQATEVKFPKC